MDDLPNIPEINWRDRPQGNKYMQKLHPAMLLDTGYKVLAEILLKGTGRRRASDSEKVWVNIIYDRSYIIAKIQREILEPLNPKDYEALEAIVSQAWEIHTFSSEEKSQNAHK